MYKELGWRQHISLGFNWYEDTNTPLLQEDDDSFAYILYGKLYAVSLVSSSDYGDYGKRLHKGCIERLCITTLVNSKSMALLF